MVKSELKVQDLKGELGKIQETLIEEIEVSMDRIVELGRENEAISSEEAENAEEYIVKLMAMHQNLGKLIKEHKRQENLKTVVTSLKKLIDNATEGDE